MPEPALDRELPDMSKHRGDVPPKHGVPEAPSGRERRLTFERIPLLKLCVKTHIIAIRESLWRCVMEYMTV